MASCDVWLKVDLREKNAPKDKNDTSIPDNEIDWSFKLSNERIRKITNTTEIKHFCEAQHLKYIAHVTRMDNNTQQKYLAKVIRLFNPPSP